MRTALDGRQMAAFVAAVESGALIEEAARAAGAALSTLYYRRERDPGFAALWDAAVARSAGPVLVWNQARRRYQKQRSRRIRFDRARKQIFLDHFAGSCNLAAAAEAAGVSPDTVFAHLRSDPAFAQGFGEALEIGYTLLEAETLGQQRAAQEAYRLRPAPEAAARNFETSMRLLRQWKRPDGRLGRRAVSPPHLGKWSFEDAFNALEKRLQAFGLRVERGEGAEEGEGAPPGLPAPG